MNAHNRNTVWHTKGKKFTNNKQTHASHTSLGGIANQGKHRAQGQFICLEQDAIQECNSDLFHSSAYFYLFIQMCNIHSKSNKILYK